MFLVTNFHDHVGLFTSVIDCYCFVSVQLVTVVFHKRLMQFTFLLIVQACP